MRSNKHFKSNAILVWNIFEYFPYRNFGVNSTRIATHYKIPEYTELMAFFRYDNDNDNDNEWEETN